MAWSAPFDVQLARAVVAGDEAEGILSDLTAAGEDAWVLGVVEEGVGVRYSD